MDLTETEEIKKRCQEYTEELYKKDLHHPDNHNEISPHIQVVQFLLKISRWLPCKTM